MAILGYPANPFNVEASSPAKQAPRNAAAAGGNEHRSINSRRSVLETAPISPAAAARRIGLLNIMENPKTPQNPANKRNRMRCQIARLSGKNARGFNPSIIARIHAVMVATVMMSRE